MNSIIVVSAALIFCSAILIIALVRDIRNRNQYDPELERKRKALRNEYFKKVQELEKEFYQ